MESESPGRLASAGTLVFSLQGKFAGFKLARTEQNREFPDSPVVQTVGSQC